MSNNNVVGVVMIGPPCCGKDTQAKFLEGKGFVVLGTGNLLRKKCEEDGVFKQTYGSKMNAGELLPDKVVNSVFNSYFKALPKEKSWVMNGFPRTIGQYGEIRNTLLSKNKKQPIVVLIFKFATIKMLQCRVLVRATEEGRSDDREDSFLKRLNEYEKNAPEIIKAVKKDSFVVIEIDATLSKEGLKSRIEGIIDFAKYIFYKV